MNTNVQKIYKQAVVQQVFSYEMLKKQIEKQDKLILLGKMQRKLVYGFTPEQQKEFDNGISVQEYFEKLDRQ